MAPQTDHQGPLMVPAGADKFRDIGRPRGAVDGNIAAGLQVKHISMLVTLPTVQEMCESCTIAWVGVVF